jgi:hypothetical protein
MPTNRISVLISLEGQDAQLRGALNRAEKSLADLSASAKTAGVKASEGLAQVKAGVGAFQEQFGRAKGQLIGFLAVFEFAGQVRQIKQTQIQELQTKARTALQQGEFDKAKEFSKQAADLASQTAQPSNNSRFRERDRPVGIGHRNGCCACINSGRPEALLLLQELHGHPKDQHAQTQRRPASQTRR